MEVSRLGFLPLGSDSPDVIATDGEYLAVSALAPARVQVYSLRKLSSTPVTTPLRGGTPTALSIGKAQIDGGGSGDPILLVANEAGIFAWNIIHAYAAVATNKQPPPLQRLLRDTSPPVSHLVLSPGRSLLAVCGRDVVAILNMLTYRVEFLLEGHNGPVLVAAFCEFWKGLLVTGGYDRTFKLWNLEKGELVHDSGIVGASPVCAIAMDPSFPRMVVGSSDGNVRFYDLAALPDCRCLQIIDVSKLLRRHAPTFRTTVECRNRPPRIISSKRSTWAANKSEGEESSLSFAHAHQCGAVLGLAYFFDRRKVLHPSGRPGIGNWLGPSPNLFVACPGSLLIVDSRSYELVGGWSFADDQMTTNLPNPTSDSPVFHVLGGIHTASQVAAGVMPDHSKASFAFCAAFSAQVAIIDLHRQGLEDTNNDTEDKGSLESIPEQESPATRGENACATGVSVFPSESARPGRLIMKACAPLQAAEPAQSPRRPCGGGKGKIGLPDHPVTFHRKVKSSGYGYINPKNKLGRRPRPPAKVRSRRARAEGVNGASCRQYPVECGLLVHRQHRNDLIGRRPIHNAGILDLEFSNDASRLATASADQTARCIRLPISRFRGDGTDFIGFNGAPKRISWNHNSTLLVTPSADRSAYLWNASSPNPLIHFTHVEGSPDDESNATPTRGKSNKRFMADVVAARFSLLDQVILLGVANKLQIYKYHLIDTEDTKDDDIMRLRFDGNKYSRIGCLGLESHNLTDIACANSFISQIALAAGSDRSITVFDLGVEESITTYENCHERQIHRIAMFPASPSSHNVSHPADAYELFATSSADNSIRLWDLRTKSSVRCFSSHANRALGAGLDFSPCLRYLATGSEDRSVFLYDLRNGGVVRKLAEGISDMVGCVAFNPVFPQLVAGTMDGRLHFFSDVV